MYRLAKANGYEHVEDFLAVYESGTELLGWIAYEKLEDEIQTNRLIHAFRTGFFGDGQARQKQVEEEEVIDTTNPDFVKNFRGFSYEKPERRAFKQHRQTSTEIIMG